MRAFKHYNPDAVYRRRPNAVYFRIIQCDVAFCHSAMFGSFFERVNTGAKDLRGTLLGKCSVKLLGENVHGVRSKPIFWGRRYDLQGGDTGKDVRLLRFTQELSAIDQKFGEILFIFSVVLSRLLLDLFCVEQPTPNYSQKRYQCEGGNAEWRERLGSCHYSAVRPGRKYIDKRRENQTAHDNRRSDSCFEPALCMRTTLASALMLQLVLHLSSPETHCLETYQLTRMPQPSSLPVSTTRRRTAHDDIWPDFHNDRGIIVRTRLE